MGARKWLHGVILVGACLPVACGDDNRPERIALSVIVAWNQHPVSVADMGYRVFVEGRWTDRIDTCAQFPDELRVTVNGLEAPRVDERHECDFDTWFDSGPFPVADPVTVRMLDRDRFIGEATFEGMFWGAGARLISPSVAEVRPGEQIVVSFPPGKGLPTAMAGRWYGLDDAPTPQLPYTLSSTSPVPDPMAFSTRVPDEEWLVGRTVLTFDTPTQEYLSGLTCRGFSTCGMWARHNLGPIFLDVRPP